ncbi:hypothetical protein AQS8620_02250 [Aquimixticola soesokkakensis]|uniref:Uncharacterized protein n=1 Tax=Aquimixticola soesokkakensis TaxID=1519096 RepID=A0A1Y5SZH2_9RHOB|nr:hypothetical protein [Aquimixticola soesokkakensis]SLN51925.1 hypothetical protein AQS8620_02250 [Aquimixticola soesokkakensis]
MSRDKTLTVFATVLFLAGAPALATDCSAWPRFSASEPALAPLSVKAGNIGPHLSDSPHSDGVKLSSKLKGRDLWIDITAFPGTTSAVVAPRMVMQLGRLADESFDRVVLADDSEGLFTLTEPEVRMIGCQFIWGREGGQNPIALMREMYRAMRHYGSGAPITTAFTGRLLGDTSLAMQINNEIVLPKWVISAVQ